jgi:Kdo2-lipid IVA lauroyltransferase/acyltransferase
VALRNALKNRISQGYAARNKHYTNYLHPRYWLTWLMLGMLWAAAQLPLKIQHGIGRITGQLGYLLMFRRRHIAETNIRLCFPHFTEKQQLRLVKRTFESNAIGLFEAASSWFTSASRFHNITRVSGLRYLLAAQRSGRGVILLGGHFSTLDLGGFLFKLYANAAAMQRDHDNPLFNLVMTRSRLRYCDKLFGKYDLRGICKWLQQGQTIWYATDQDYGRRSSVFAPFFGVPAATLTTTSRIARKTGALVIPYSHFRTSLGCYELHFGKALQDYPSGDDIMDATITNKILEEAIRLHPDQYLWLHRRFKTRPDRHVPGIYNKTGYL